MTPSHRTAHVRTWLFVALSLATILSPSCADADTSTNEILGPPRIIAANAGACDLVLALAPPEWLVALPQIARQYSPTVREMGGLTDHPPLPPFGVESTLALNPDLVVAHAWQGAEALAKLEDLSIPVLVLDDPVRAEDFGTALRELGLALERTSEAEDAARSIEARLDALKEQQPERRPTAVVYSNYGAGGTLPALGTTYDLVLTLAGLENAATAAGLVGHADSDHERLLSLDPDWIIVGSSLEDPLVSPSEEQLTSTSVLQALRAVRDGHIVIVPSAYLHATSHRLIDASEFIATRVHGEPK